ncbi:hypothetical protein [Sphingomonas sp. 28-63-12]|uniref:hypothetical protein n=1 Tax=Sphingomonas sp. 28-63-12 TaxID=1970434 RepID=UPI0035A85CB9
MDRATTSRAVPSQAAPIADVAQSSPHGRMLNDSPRIAQLQATAALLNDRAIAAPEPALPGMAGDILQAMMDGDDDPARPPPPPAAAAGALADSEPTTAEVFGGAVAAAAAMREPPAAGNAPPRGAGAHLIQSDAALAAMLATEQYDDQRASAVAKQGSATGSGAAYAAAAASGAAAAPVLTSGNRSSAAGGGAARPDAPRNPFSAQNILFSSQSADAQHAAERSLYFRHGRLRLDHPEGPHISDRATHRYTFRELPPVLRVDGQTHYEPEDVPRDWRPSAAEPWRVPPALKQAAIGDTGSLFEMSASGGTHHSRGRPIAEPAMDQARLDRLHEIAAAADAALKRHRRALEDAEDDLDEAEEAWIAAGRPDSGEKFQHYAATRHRHDQIKRKLHHLAAPFNAAIRDTYQPPAQGSASGSGSASAAGSAASASASGTIAMLPLTDRRAGHAGGRTDGGSGGAAAVVGAGAKRKAAAPAAAIAPEAKDAADADDDYAVDVGGDEDDWNEDEVAPFDSDADNDAAAGPAPRAAVAAADAAAAPAPAPAGAAAGGAGGAAIADTPDINQPPAKKPRTQK